MTSPAPFEGRNDLAVRLEEMANWAESDEVTVRPGATIVRDDKELHALARRKFDAGAADDQELRAAVVRARSGRRKLDPDEGPGPSLMWQVRVPVELDEAVRERAASTGQPLSQVIRQAVARYLQAS
jgi:hypothetical protein